MSYAHEKPASVVGTWELVSLSWLTPDGRTIHPWGNPVGRITYDADGNVQALLMHERRNLSEPGSTAAPNVQSSYSSYFGTYEIDGTTGIITHRVAGSLNSDASGELRRTFTFEIGDLVLGFNTVRDGVPVTRRLVWRRLSPRSAS
jgi:hypothetical protein